MKENAPKSKKAAALLPILLVAVMALSIAPTAHAYGGGAANWQVAFAHTDVFPGSGGLGLKGWCDLSGSSTPSNPTSGNSGDCRASLYFFAPGGGAVQCAFAFAITSWGEAPGLGLFLSPVIPNDLWVFAGTITLAPTQGCAAIGSLVTIVTELGPAQSGHYNFDFLLELFGIPVGEYQVQMAQTTH